MVVAAAAVAVPLAGSVKYSDGNNFRACVSAGVHIMADIEASAHCKDAVPCFGAVRTVGRLGLFTRKISASMVQVFGDGEVPL